MLTAEELRGQILQHVEQDARFASEGQIVYFLQAESLRRIKIGRCQSKRRLRRIVTINADRLRLVAVIPGGYEATESALHGLFRYVNFHGEWFGPLPSLLETVEWVRERWPEENEDLPKVLHPEAAHVPVCPLYSDRGSIFALANLLKGYMHSTGPGYLLHALRVAEREYQAEGGELSVVYYGRCHDCQRELDGE